MSHKDLPRFVELLRTAGGKRVLDVGCGTGRHVVALAKEGFEVWGIDVAETATKEAGLWLRQEGLSADVRAGDFYKKLPYQAGFFDGVISTKAIHHARTSEIKGAIEEIGRVVRPGGILMVEVPAKDPERATARKKQNEIEPGTFVSADGPEKGIPHHIFSSEEELRGFFSGFRVISVHTTDREETPPSLHYVLFARKPA